MIGTGIVLLIGGVAASSLSILEAGRSDRSMTVKRGVWLIWVYSSK